MAVNLRFVSASCFQLKQLRNKGTANKDKYIDNLRTKYNLFSYT